MLSPGPREKILEQELCLISDEEILCVLLGVRPERGLAKRLLSELGGLRPAILAGPAAWRNIPGLGPARIGQLLAAKAIAIRTSQAPLATTFIRSPQDAEAVLTDLRWEEQELVVALFLSGQNGLLRRETVFKGGLESSVARPREILRAALAVNASKIIVAHNHPSHDAEPSEEDVRFTARLEFASREVGIQLLDHLVLAGNSPVFSFAGNGLLKGFTSSGSESRPNKEPPAARPSQLHKAKERRHTRKGHWRCPD